MTGSRALLALARIAGASATSTLEGGAGGCGAGGSVAAPEEALAGRTTSSDSGDWTVAILCELRATSLGL